MKNENLGNNDPEQTQKSEVTETSANQGTEQTQKSESTETSANQGTEQTQKSEVTETSANQGTEQTQKSEVTETSANQGTEQIQKSESTEISANQGTEQIQKSETSETSANTPTSDEDKGTTKKPNKLDRVKSSERPEKGLNGIVPDLFKNNKNNDSDHTKANTIIGEHFPNQTEEDKYKTISTSALEDRQRRNERETKKFSERFDNLRDEIDAYDDDYNEAVAGDERRKYKKKIDKLETESKKVKEYLEHLEDETGKITKELDKRKLEDNNQDKSLEEIEIVSPRTLFKEEYDIENIIFYVATLFPGLNVQDFKRVVGLLLEGRTKSIPINTSEVISGNPTNDQPTVEGNIDILGKIGTSQNNQFQSHTPFTQKVTTKELTEIWEESFDKPNQYFNKCHLKVERKNGKQAIVFSYPKLREDFLAYFETEQIFFFEQQLQRTQELDLFFDKSQTVAEHAIKVSVKAAVYYPDDYAEDWLINLLKKIAEKDEKIQEILLIRLSRLIYKLQIEPEYSHSETIAQKFLNTLIYPQFRSLAFFITRFLIYLHLDIGLFGIQSAINILNWLKELLDLKQEENINDKYIDIQPDIYNLLENILWDSGNYSYIYELLNILKEWLPEKTTSPAKYSFSNKVVLSLFFEYCVETTLRIDEKLYGQGYRVYPLFEPLTGSDENNIKKEFETLVNWLLYQSPDKKLAIKYVKSYFDDNENNPLKIISFLIAEWFVIIWGFKDEEPEEEALYLFDNLLYHIIVIASRSQQREIMEFWTELTEEYLNKSVEYEKSGEKDLKKKFVIRRKLLRELKKRFKSLQQEIKSSQQKNLDNN